MIKYSNVQNKRRVSIRFSRFFKAVSFLILVDILCGFTVYGDSVKKNNSIQTHAKTNTSAKSNESLSQQVVSTKKSKSIINCLFPIESLLGIWTVDLNGPHADFKLTESTYFLVDSDGDGSHSYSISQDVFVIHFPGFDSKGKILKAQHDTLVVIWDDQPQTTYFRWKR